MQNLKEISPFIFVILIGVLIYLLDLFEFSSESARTGILATISLFKSAYFLWLLLTRLKRTAGQDFFFYEFARFIALSVLLVVVSFALDYYCLFRIDETEFRGVLSDASRRIELLTFFYFSVSTFTTAGLGDITPLGMVAQALVALQLCIGWLTTVLVIGNVAHLRESLTKKSE